MRVIAGGLCLVLSGSLIIIGIGGWVMVKVLEYVRRDGFLVVVISWSIQGLFL